MLAAYLLDATRSSQAIELLALEQLGYRALDARGRLREGREGTPFGDVPIEAMSTTRASARTWRCSWPTG
jgi:hypothetical protein